MATDLVGQGSATGQEMAAADARRAAAQLDIGGFKLRPMLVAHFRVIGAVTLRDIKTRVAGSHFAFILSLFQPLAHIAIMLTIYYIVGRRAPIGTDTTIFLASGALPFVVWLYAFRNIKTAPVTNRSLLKFPGVTLIDLLLARSIVELISTPLVCLFTLLTLQLLGFDVLIFNPPRFAFIILQCYLMGLCMGFLFAVLSLVSHLVLMLGNLLTPVFWLTSGVLFIPAMLPEQLREWFWYLPLSQLVDATRTAFYGYYISDFYSGAYVGAFMLASITISFILMYTLRTRITEH